MIAQAIDLSGAEAVVVAAAFAAGGTWLAARAGSAVQRRAAAQERAAALARAPAEAFTTALSAYENVIAMLNAEVRRLADESAAIRVDLVRCRREREELRHAMPPGVLRGDHPPDLPRPVAGPPDR